MFCNMYVANNSSILQYCHGMSIEGVLVFYRTTEYANSWKGGGLNCKAKAQVLVVTPPPLFLESRSQKGGGVTAGQYGIYCYTDMIYKISNKSHEMMELPRSTLIYVCSASIKSWDAHSHFGSMCQGYAPTVALVVGQHYVHSI